MTIREVYEKSIQGNFESLSLLIEFLVYEKKVLGFEDNSKELDLYFKPRNKPKMNYLLNEYRKGSSELHKIG